MLWILIWNLWKRHNSHRWAQTASEYQPWSPWSSSSLWSLRSPCQPWGFCHHISAQPDVHHQLPRTSNHHDQYFDRHHHEDYVHHENHPHCPHVCHHSSIRSHSRTLTSALRSPAGQTMEKFRDRSILDRFWSPCMIYKCLILYHKIQSWIIKSQFCFQRSNGKWVATKRFSQRQIEKEKIRYVHSRGNPRLDYVTFAAQVFLFYFKDWVILKLFFSGERGRCRQELHI